MPKSKTLTQIRTNPEVPSSAVVVLTVEVVVVSIVVEVVVGSVVDVDGFGRVGSVIYLGLKVYGFTVSNLIHLFDVVLILGLNVTGFCGGGASVVERKVRRIQSGGGFLVVVVDVVVGGKVCVFFEDFLHGLMLHFHLWTSGNGRNVVVVVVVRFRSSGE